MPDDAPDDVREDSLAYGAGHYSIEVVADLPVHVASQCYLGQLNDWFGRYTRKTGLEARLCIRKPGDHESIGDAAQCHPVEGKRTTTALTAGINDRVTVIETVIKTMPSAADIATLTEVSKSNHDLLLISRTQISRIEDWLYNGIKR